MHLLITLIAKIKLNYVKVLIMGSLIYLSGCGGGNEPTGNPISLSPISTSPAGTVSQDQPAYFGHPVYNNILNTNANPHPDAYHLYETIPADVPPAVTKETVATLHGELLTEIKLFQEDVLRQANSIYSDFSAGIQTSNDPIIQAVDTEFVRQVERCGPIEWSPSRTILSYQRCLLRLAYRVPTGGIIITELRDFFTERGATEYQFQLGLESLPRPNGFVGHGVYNMVSAFHNDEREYTSILFLARGVVSGGFTNFLTQDEDRIEQSQVSLNRSALIFEGAINNFRGIRTGVFDF